MPINVAPCENPTRARTRPSCSLSAFSINATVSSKRTIFVLFAGRIQLPSFAFVAPEDTFSPANHHDRIVSIAVFSFSLFSIFFSSFTSTSKTPSTQCGASRKTNSYSRFNFFVRMEPVLWRKTRPFCEKPWKHKHTCEDLEEEACFFILSSSFESSFFVLLVRLCKSVSVTREVWKRSEESP